MFYLSSIEIFNKLENLIKNNIIKFYLKLFKNKINERYNISRR